MFGALGVNDKAPSVYNSIVCSFRVALTEPVSRRTSTVLLNDERHVVELIKQ